jgi:hypothetical protein
VQGLEGSQAISGLLHQCIANELFRTYLGRLFRHKDEIHIEGCLCLLRIDLGDQRTVSRGGDAYMEVWWPTGIASWEVRGVVILTLGAGLLHSTMCGIIVAVSVCRPPLNPGSLKSVAVSRRTHNARDTQPLSSTVPLWSIGLVEWPKAVRTRRSAQRRGSRCEV